VKDNVKKVLLEGAQGFELDINWTNHYPYCTSSTCTLGGAINTGVPLKSIKDIYGIAKAYDTYVGLYKFQPEEYDSMLNLLGDLGHEYGSTTGRRRQCNFLNMDHLIEALSLNNCNICIINKADIIQKANIYRLYYDNELRVFTDFLSMQNFINEKLNGIGIDVVFSFSPDSI